MACHSHAIALACAGDTSQADRGGPERFVCKGNCQTEFNASLSSGVFHREDGLSVECLAVPPVVWRSSREFRVFR
jgi:hypothetical protein